MLFSKLLGTQVSGARNILYMWGDNSQGTLSLSFVGVSSISSPIQVDTSTWAKLSVGTLHTMGIKSNGTLWAWGGNLYGQCGYQTAYGQYKSSPISVGTGWQAVDVSLGGQWALGIKTDGTLWSWGNNAGGALGTASLTSTSSPVLVSGPAGASWSAISAGTSHALAITTVGRLYAWGLGGGGRLGDLTVVNKSSPVLVSGPAATSWIAVSAGGAHSMAIAGVNNTYVWGTNINGQLGANIPTALNVSSPVFVGGAISISAGDTHSLAVSASGIPFATGSASAGQLGNSSLLQVSGFVVVSGPAATSWVSVSAGLSHSAGITQAGRLYAWGLNTSGQVGINSLTSVSSPVLVSGPATTSWSFVRVKNLTSLALTTQGVLYSWGSNVNWNIGLPASQSYSSPVAITAPASGSWTAASASTSFGHFIDSQNNFYFSGDGLTYFYPTLVASSPQQVGSSSWTIVSAGDGFSLGITTEGRLFSWGYNLNGEGGRLTTTDTFTPTLVSGPATTSWSAIAAAGQFSLGITTLGALYAWGSGASGRLGDGTTVSKSSPIKIGSSAWNAVGGGAGTGYGIDAVGRLFAWGLNTSGQVGISTLVSVSSPVLVSGPASTSWALVAGGGLHALAATTTRVLYAWGLNTSGQLGNNLALTTSSPVLVAAPGILLSWRQISTGYAHSLGVRSDRTLWSWGNNAQGQLGTGPLTSVSSPLQIGTSSWSAVAAGLSSSYAIRSDGTLWSWGGNSVGQLGILSTIATSSPVLVSGPAGASWAVIAAGGGNPGGLGKGHVLAITNEGRLYAWGDNAIGQLGDISVVSKSSPVLVSGPATTSWSFISAGVQFSLAVTSTGRLYGWGTNGEGELGDTTIIDKSSPVLVSGPAATSWASIAAGAWHSLAITTTGRLYAWGWNTFGQLGDLSVTLKTSPVLVSGPAATSWSVVYGSGNGANPYGSQSYAITTLGVLYAWGNNSFGQLGDNTLVNKSSPILVSGPALTSWSALSSGGQANATVIAITTAGLGYGWGLNTSGQVGINSVANVSSPVVIQATETIATSVRRSWQQISTGGEFSLGIMTDKTLWSWGSGGLGQLGSGTSTNVSSPIQIGVSSWNAVAAGSLHSLAIRSDGTLWSWGWNSNGQLGILSTVQTSSPVLVSGTAGASWVSISAGGGHSVGITTQGRLYAWGQGDSGQLGNSALTNSSSPILVSGPATTSWIAVSAGGNQSFGITSLGVLYGWGHNGAGELGDSTLVSRSLPVLVSGPAATSWASVAAGFWHTLGITTEGRLYAWGYNASGQVGDLAVITRSTPVLVSGPATTSWAFISAGGNQASPFGEQSYAITTLGRLYAWGGNSNGQLGDLTTVDKSSPVLVSGPATTSWSFLSSAGTANATILAITTTGLGYGWGANTAGQIGDSSQTNRSSPVQIPQNTILSQSTYNSWAAVAAGLSHSVGITSTGKLYAWGANTNGQLGDLTTTNKSSPILVSGPSATSWTALGQGYAGNFAGAITGDVVIPPLPPVIVVGQVAYTTPGTYSWTCPAGVTSVSVVTVGGGGGRGATTPTTYYRGGGGGGLGYKNNISVTPGTLYTVVVGAGGGAGANGGNSYFISAVTVQGGGGTYAGAGGTYVGDGGGNGGASNTGSFSGGGGAGGYSGNGGAAGIASGASGPGNAGSGGGGGGGSSYYATAGGGVGILGQGANGTAGGSGGANTSAGGGGGSGGENGKGYAGTGAGALYGGGGLQSDGGGSVDGGNGAVRIIWPGTTRQFPATDTGDL